MLTRNKRKETFQQLYWWQHGCCWWRRRQRNAEQRAWMGDSAPAGHCVCLRFLPPNASLQRALILRFLILIHRDLVSELRKRVMHYLGHISTFKTQSNIGFNTPEAEFTVFPPYFSDQCVTCPLAWSGELASILETWPVPTLAPAHPWFGLIFASKSSESIHRLSSHHTWWTQAVIPF